jgi:hypothetical protein
VPRKLKAHVIWLKLQDSAAGACILKGVILNIHFVVLIAIAGDPDRANRQPERASFETRTNDREE